MAILTFIQKTTFRFVDFCLGQTPLFIVIFGWFLIVTGIIFFAQPEKARRNILGKGFGVVKAQLFFLTLYLILLLFGLTAKISGMFSLVLLIGGIVGIVKLFFFALARISQVFLKYAAQIPERYFKAFALLQMVVGTLMVMLHKRIW